MRQWLSRLDPEIPVALEATFGWPWVADLLEELGHPVHLGHPPVIRALAKHEAKTRPLRQRSAGKVPASRHLAGELPGAAGGPPATGADPLSHGAVALADGREEPHSRRSCTAWESCTPSATCSARQADAFCRACDCPTARGRPCKDTSTCSTNPDAVDRRGRAVDGGEPGRGRDRAAVDDDSRHRA